MFSSDIVEVAIGLAFMYFVLSLICSTITEFITRMVAMRAITLEGAVRNLLSGAKPQGGSRWGSLMKRLHLAKPSPKATEASSNGQTGLSRNSRKRLKATELVEAQKSVKRSRLLLCEVLRSPHDSATQPAGKRKGASSTEWQAILHLVSRFHSRAAGYHPTRRRSRRLKDV